jgi:ubiquinone/menaquinone biosynthesis C-methylase UbiE
MEKNRGDSALSSDGFYESLALNYDDMTRFKDRLDSERKILESWQRRLKLESVVDAACGTGIHAILFAGVGVKVTGADISAAMLKKARQNAGKSGVSIKWVRAPMERLSAHVKGNHDAVFCLGNSMPHLLGYWDFARALVSFYKVLKKGGTLVLQLLNYDRVLERRERIVGIHREDGIEYIRFYDFLGDLIRFNILKVQRKGGGYSHGLTSTLLYPYRKGELLDLFNKSYFRDIKFYGDLKLGRFNLKNSRDIVITARK